ncbi:MAG: hypothetical protein ACHREM_04155 [Polyangiales bacterium]
MRQLHTRERDTLEQRIKTICTALGLTTAALARDVRTHLGIVIGPKRIDDAKYGSFPNLLVGLSNQQVAQIWQHLERHAAQAKAKGLGRKPSLTATGRLHGRPVHIVSPGQLAIGELAPMCRAVQKANLTDVVDEVTCKTCLRELRGLGVVSADGRPLPEAQRIWERWAAKFTRGG